MLNVLWDTKLHVINTGLRNLSWLNCYIVIIVECKYITDADKELAANLGEESVPYLVL